MLSYAPLLNQLKEKQITLEQLQTDTKIHRTTLSKLQKNQYVSMKTLDIFCNYLHCSIQQVICYQKSKK